MFLKAKLRTEIPSLFNVEPSRKGFLGGLTSQKSISLSRLGLPNARVRVVRSWRRVRSRPCRLRIGRKERDGHLSSAVQQIFP